MVDPSLVDFQRSQAERISCEIIEQCEQYEQKIQADAHKQWENAHNKLVDLLRFLDQDFDESCEKANRPLKSFNDDDLAFLILVRLRNKQGVIADKSKGNEIQVLKQQLEEISQKYLDLQQELSNQQALNKNLREEISALEAHISALYQIQKENLDSNQPRQEVVTIHSKPGEPLPEWFHTWQQSNSFKKTSTTILVMGETGFALRPSIIKETAKRLKLAASNKNLDEAINWLIAPEENPDKNFIEQITETTTHGSSAGGNLPAVLRLTEDGQTAFQILSGKLHIENEYDRLIKHHSTPEHTILNIQAGEILVNEGYKIKAQAYPINLSNGESYIPDIVAVDQKTGELLFIEVERDVNKDHLSRKTRWMKLYEAANGNLYVFCDNLNCQRNIQGEINMALNGLKYNSFLTNLHGIRSGKRSLKDSSIWISQRTGKTA